MVFMSSSVLGWSPILEAWLQKLPEQQADALKLCFNCCYQARTREFLIGFRFSVRQSLLSVCFYEN